MLRSILMTGLAAAVFGSPVVQAAMTVGTGQFSSKLYTEGLGRVPDQSGWGGIVNYWNSRTCDISSLQSNVRDILNSAEFLNNSPTSQERAFRLYRAALNRDASASELTSIVNQINSGVSWLTVVNNLLGTMEFSNRVPTYCGSAATGWQSTVPANLVVTNTGAATNEQTLRSALLSASYGSTVYVEQGAVIYLSSSLTIPAGVTLATVGQPGKAKAPLLGRLVRSGTFTGPLVELLDNSNLKSVWVDDQRNRFGYPRNSLGQALNSPPVYVRGSNVRVSNNIISDSTTWTHLQYLHSGTSCDGGRADNNLITAYGSNHWDSTWSDGISIACKNVMVDYNEVIDATDVGIIVFTVYPDVQKSQVLNNTIVNVGNSAWGGIVADPLSNASRGFENVPLGVYHDFTGSQFLNNLIWSNSKVHLDFVISAGTRPWFGTGSFTGKGVKFNGNNSGSQSVTSYVAIAVSGMVNASVQANAFTALPAPLNLYTNCGLRGVAVAPQPYADNYDVQPNVVVNVNDPIVIGCTWHK